MKLKPVSYTNLNSTAIESLIVDGNSLSIEYKTSKKIYNYTIIDSNIPELLDKTIKNCESVGKFVNSLIKEEKIKQIASETK